MIRHSGRSYGAPVGGSVVTADREDMIQPFKHHPRDWRSNFYVYPVISRRSGGLSIGVNLNPDKACNFDCVYCQVDRTKPSRLRKVNPARLHDELKDMITDAVSGVLFEDHAFAQTPDSMRRISDIAFSGDGEPTTCKQFRECVQLAANLKRDAGLSNTRLVLITDACYLTKPSVVEALAILDDHQGQIWAKLDAGTEPYFRKVNRPNYTLAHVMENIIAAAIVRPIVIQSLFMRLHDESPSDAELSAYIDRLNEIVAGGGAVDFVQVYTIARDPAESYVTSLPDSEVDAIVARVETETDLRAEAYYGG